MDPLAVQTEVTFRMRRREEDAATRRLAAGALGRARTPRPGIGLLRRSSPRSTRRARRPGTGPPVVPLRRR